MLPKLCTKQSKKRERDKEGREVEEGLAETSHVRGSSFPGHGAQRCQTDVETCRVCSMSCGCRTAIKETRASRAPKIQLEGNFKRCLIVKLPLAKVPPAQDKTNRTSTQLNRAAAAAAEKPPKDKKMKKKIYSQAEEKLQANARHVN